MSSQKTQDRVAIVTGATSGIGVDIARDLLSTGYKVALVGRRAELGTLVATSLDPTGAHARFFEADVASYASQASMFRAVHALWGRIDVLCANAGITDKSSVYQLTAEHGGARASADDVPPAPDLEATDVCYKGVVYGTMLAVHFMRFNSPTPGGKIIVTGSVGAFHPHRVVPEYCGAKAAVVQFVRGVAPVLKVKDGVTINVVHPGLVQTPIIPQEMIKAVPEGCPTPVETIIKGYRVYLEDDTGRTGEQMEASGTNLVYYDPPAYANGIATEGATTVWEPWFIMGHGVETGLPNTYK
ncbi:D-threitol dehydrogenase [Lasiodiplodia theobromae]|uniref:D-threitol dehydrogenase n=1 Tax=Lasiodiplodia theobromae TaxID=45133 RepID=A0A5N5DET3_9PEZI|nr:D-threitol dehydrogenase [Lasiodiplodia theobromae]